MNVSIQLHVSQVRPVSYAADFSVQIEMITRLPQTQRGHLAVFCIGF